MAPPPPPRVAAVADPSRASAPAVDTGLGVTSDGDDDALSVDSDEAAQLVAAVESLPDVGLNEDDDDPSPQLGLVADEVAALMSKQEGVCAVPSISDAEGCVTDGVCGTTEQLRVLMEEIEASDDEDSDGTVTDADSAGNMEPAAAETAATAMSSGRDSSDADSDSDSTPATPPPPVVSSNHECLRRPH